MKVLIVGGGWSGLAAAVTLSQRGIQVHVIESAQQLGGRARNVVWQDKIIDNGQHLMIGAYDRMLSMLSLLGVNHNQAFIRTPIDLTILDTVHSPLRISAHGLLPWPLSLAWNLFRSAGMSSLVQLRRLQNDIPTILNQDDISVATWLKKTHQSQRFIKQLWEPLCLATLNTPINIASAHLLAHVLNDSLGQGQSDADLLIPQQPLGSLFPEKAAEYLLKNGSQISLGQRVASLISDNGQIKGIVTSEGKTILADHVIIATSPSIAFKLLENLSPIPKPDELPICTVYLQYENDICLPKQPILGLSGTLSQWVFDRSTQHPGLIAVVISGPGAHQSMSKPTLIEQVSAELHQHISTLPPQAKSAFIIREKRATFASTIAYHQQRPSHKTNIEGLWLTGDYTANNYPATLEGAIRNGERSASAILENNS